MTTLSKRKEITSLLERFITKSIIGKPLNPEFTHVFCLGGETNKIFTINAAFMSNEEIMICDDIVKSKRIQMKSPFVGTARIAFGIKHEHAHLISPDIIKEVISGNSSRLKSEYVSTLIQIIYETEFEFEIVTHTLSLEDGFVKGILETNEMRLSKEEAGQRMGGAFVRLYAEKMPLSFFMLDHSVFEKNKFREFKLKEAN